MFTFACFRIPDSLSRAVRITRWVAGLALTTFNWWAKTKAHHIVKDIEATASLLAAASSLMGRSRWPLILCTQSAHLN